MWLTLPSRILLFCLKELLVWDILLLVLGSHPLCPFVVVNHWATAFWSLSPRMLTTAEKAFEGALWHVAGSVCWDWGRGLWAFSALCLGRASCTLSGWPALPFTFCLPPVATSWQLMCTHDQLRGTLRAGLMDALLGWGWGWCWQPVKAEFGGWLAVPELSDQFGEICSQTAACPLAASSWCCDGVGLGCLKANEQQLSVLKLDYMFRMAAFWLKQWRLCLSWNDEICFLFFFKS